MKVATENFIQKQIPYSELKGGDVFSIAEVGKNYSYDVLFIFCATGDSASLGDGWMIHLLPSEMVTLIPSAAVVIHPFSVQ